ncbi:MAG: zinc ABC transporter substrate-binding protein [Actinomycetota bacterium]
MSVAAAFYPLAFAAQMVGGADVDVFNVTPSGSEPHDIELAPGAIRRVNEASLVLYLGGGFQPAVENVIRSLPDRSRAIDALEGLVLERSTESGNAVDPHVWLDPVLWKQVVRKIGSAIARLVSGSRRDAITLRTTEALGKLDALHREYETTLRMCKRRSIVTSHAAFAYLAKRYQLSQIAISGISPEQEPSPKRLAEVARIARANGATTIFFETLVSPRIAETVARQTGASTAMLNPIEGLSSEESRRGADYFSVMRENLRSLSKALGCAR